jgi:hypothetical protein
MELTLNDMQETMERFNDGKISDEDDRRCKLIGRLRQEVDNECKYHFK